MAASGELNFPFGELFKDRLHNMLPVFGKTRVPKTYARACALLGYVHNQPRLQGLDSTAPNNRKWEGALSGPEMEAFELCLLRRACGVFARASLPRRYRHKRDLRVYLKKVQWQVWPK